MWLSRHIRNPGGQLDHPNAGMLALSIVGLVTLANCVREEGQVGLGEIRTDYVNLKGYQT